VLDGFAAVGFQSRPAGIYLQDQRCGIQTHVDALRAILKIPGTIGLAGVVATNKANYLGVADPFSWAAELRVSEWVDTPLSARCQR
jgi:hypothetical protein